MKGALSRSSVVALRDSLDRRWPRVRHDEAPGAQEDGEEEEEEKNLSTSAWRTVSPSHTELWNVR
jgi:hypothetical protein